MIPLIINIHARCPGSKLVIQIGTNQEAIHHNVSHPSYAAKGELINGLGNLSYLCLKHVLLSPMKIFWKITWGVKRVIFRIMVIEERFRDFFWVKTHWEDLSTQQQKFALILLYLRWQVNVWSVTEVQKSFFVVVEIPLCIFGYGNFLMEFWGYSKFFA